jgi:hypothetical protein
MASKGTPREAKVAAAFSTVFRSLADPMTKPTKGASFGGALMGEKVLLEKIKPINNA